MDRTRSTLSEQGDPGWIYVLECDGRYKIGKTTDSQSRMRAARTWLPNMKVLACKPFWAVSEIERDLHAGFCADWYAGEWFEIDQHDIDLLLEAFSEFSDTDRDANTTNFQRWCASVGMLETLIERERQGGNLRRFLARESFKKRTEQ